MQGPATMSQSEVGPNDIVIHLVNPYKCGDCGSEFCLRSLFLDHLTEHIDLLKATTPCHQITCVTSLVEQQSGGITVTRDILQINEQQMFELQDLSLDYTQLTPLKVLEQAGILSLPRPLQLQPKPAPKENPIILDVRNPRDNGRKQCLLKNQQPQLGNTGLPVQILNTSQKKVFPEASQICIQGSDTCVSDLEMIVQQALSGHSKTKRECSITIANSIQLADAQSSSEVMNPDNENINFVGMDNKSILGRGKMFPAMKGKGNIKRGVTCVICSNVFANAGVLERHQVVHTGAKPFTCNICFKEFNDLSSHRKHSLIHKRQYRCPVCHHMYLRRTQLLLHMKQHKKKRFIQFGNNFHEVHVSVTRNSEGQLVQEYSLPLLSALEGTNKSLDVSKEEDQTLLKLEFNEALREVNTSTAEEKENDNVIFKGEERSEAEQKKKIIYRCGHCKTIIFTRPTLSRHLIKHTNTRPFQCEKCLKSFHDKADLLHHHKTHTKPVQCKTCLSSFSKVLYLQNHLLKGCPVVENDSRYTLLPDLRCQCNICQKVLKNKANVLRHLRVHAFQERNKTSGQADVEVAAAPENLPSSDLGHLSQNVEDHFQGLPNSVGYHCLICGQDFRFKSFIITHVRMHLNQRPYKCPDCPKSFFARQMLKKHQQNHSRPYKCPACHKSFIRRYLMKDHFNKRHGREDPLKDITELIKEKLIQCDICGKTMKSYQKSVMLCHIRLHKDVRPFKCKVCCKTFISDNALRKHSLNHSKPYKCHICDKGFSRRYLLTDHFKKKCGRKKKGNSEQNVVSRIVNDPQERKTDEVSGDLPPSTVDASTECRPYETKIITYQDPATGMTTYTCEPCDKMFTIYDALVRHINTFSRPTSCKYCRLIFEDKHLTISHQRSCLGPSVTPPLKYVKKNKAVGGQQEKVQKIMKHISTKIETLTSETTATTSGTSSSEIADNLVRGLVKSSVLSSSSEQTAFKDSSGDSQATSTPVRRILHVPKEELGSLPCPECDRSFHTARGLKIHASSHVRLFKCEVCDKDFTQISSLRAHAKIHKNGLEAATEEKVEMSARTPKRRKQHREYDMAEEKKNEEGDAVKRRKVEHSVKIALPGRRRSRKVAVSDEDDKGSVFDRVAEMQLEHKDLEGVSQRLLLSGTRGRPYSCKMCRRRFTEQTGLNAHMLQNHGVRS